MKGATAGSELFDAVRSAVEQLSRAAPVLVVVEDLHWADLSTRKLLSVLFARQLPTRVSIVASYRVDDLHRRHPLREDVAQWSRTPGVRRLHLRPLPDAEVRVLVRELQPGTLSERDVEGVVARAEGNAFFAEELVAAALRGDRVLSADLADLLLLHLDQLDEPARRVVRAVSVAGRRVPHSLLEAVLSPDEPNLDRALRAAIERNVLVAVQPEGYAFRHALLAEVVYDDLLPGERVGLHRAFAKALSSGAIAGGDGELARHARAAHDLPTAFTAAVSAGDAAMAVGGPAEATRHYEMALELLAEDPSAGGPNPNAVDLVLRANRSAVAAGSLHRALALVQDQLANMPTDVDRNQRILLLNAAASTALLDDAPIDALALTTEALRLLPTRSPSALRALVLAVHAQANASRGRREDATRWATEAAELARTLDLPAVLADATTTLVRLARHPVPEQAEQALRTSIAEARTAGDAPAELRSTFALGTLLYELARLGEAQRAYEQAAARAAELRRPWAPYGIDGRALASIVSYTRGDWGTAGRLADTSDESAPPLATATLSAVGLVMSAGRGDLAAIDHLPQLRPWWDRDGFIAVVCGAAAIDLHGDAGSLKSAVAVHDEVVALVGALWEKPLFQARIRLGGLLLGQLAASAASVGARERVWLADIGRQVYLGAVAAGAILTSRGLESEAWLARVEAEDLRLRWLTADGAVDRDRLVRAWRDAVEAFEAFGHVFETARSRSRLASALNALGDPAEAQSQAARATSTARALGARPLLRELRAIGPLSAPRKASDPQLTARERQVLVLAAQGRSNREIAQVLYISAKTASVHVSNILAKLQAGGRTEAVAIARRQGLLPDEA